MNCSFLGLKVNKTNDDIFYYSVAAADPVTALLSCKVKAIKDVITTAVRATDVNETPP